MLDEVLNRWPSLGAIEVSTAQYGQFASVEGRVERALVAGSRLHRASERRRNSLRHDPSPSHRDRRRPRPDEGPPVDQPQRNSGDELGWIPEDAVQKGGIVAQVAPPEATRLADEAIEPLEPASLHPFRSLWQRSGVNVEGRPHADENRCVQTPDVVGHPSLLLRRTQAHPDDVGPCLVHRSHELRVLFGRRRSERR
jgi:hypothetical protein